MHLSAHSISMALSRLRLFLVSIFLLLLGCTRATSVSVAESPAATLAGSEQSGAAAALGTLEAGDSMHSLTFAGLPREYLLHVPPDYDPARPTPIVLVFHGIGLDANEMVRITGFSAQADASGFIVAYPNGTGDKKSWNGGMCCGEAARNRTDDIGFVKAVIADIASFANIDTTRIYATGFSNGAFLVYRLACEMADQIAAFGPVGATQALKDEQACQPARPVPLIHFHGTADKLNPYDGLTTGAGIEFVSVPHAIAHWADLNGCSATPSTTLSGQIIHEVYSLCKSGVSIELYTVTDGEHAWPGGEAVSAQVGEPTIEISTTPLMWDFFAAHPLP